MSAYAYWFQLVSSRPDLKCVVFAEGVDEEEARQAIEQIHSAGSPEEAARIGRSHQRQRPHLVRPDWETAKLFVMYAGLQVKVPLPHLPSLPPPSPFTTP